MDSPRVIEERVRQRLVEADREVMALVSRVDAAEAENQVLTGQLEAARGIAGQYLARALRAEGASDA